VPSADKGKINHRARRGRRVFLAKDKKYKSFHGNEVLLAFRSSGYEDQRMSEEETESAEIIPRKILSRVDLPGRMGKRAASPLAF
jgi:hypothetical protein